MARRMRHGIGGSIGTTNDGRSALRSLLRPLPSSTPSTMASNDDAAAEPLAGDAATDTKPTATAAADSAATDSVVAADTPFKIQVATWPEALPADEESHVMSIVCGNSHLHWALHNDARGENLNPNLCECMCLCLLVP